MRELGMTGAMAMLAMSGALAERPRGQTITFSPSADDFADTLRFLGTLRDTGVRSAARGPRKPVKSKALAKRHAANKRARKARRNPR